jgi:hypothetical protein
MPTAYLLLLFINQVLNQILNKTETKPMITTINTNSNPQPRWGVHQSSSSQFTSTGKTGYVLAPTQIAGLVPLICSDQDPRLPPFSKCDCREWVGDQCYINPVFASTADPGDLLKNDRNMFLIEYPFFYQYQWAQPALSAMSLEEWNGSQWVTTTTLTDNTYGYFYDFGDKCIPNWKGFDIDWSAVIGWFGEGLYRFRVDYDIYGNVGILVSEPFCLKEWTCSGTDVTVRWECTITGGRLGSIIDDKRIFEFCCNKGGGPAGMQLTATPVTWNDQIRVYAFFGREKTEYERSNVEYANGEIIQVRNEAIQKFEYESALQPKWVHDRLKAYCFMADEIYVTDYNWNNSDYEIDKRRVTCDGSYEPEYNENTRYSNVRVQFKEGFQNVIRDKCCSTPKRTPLG